MSFRGLWWTLRFCSQYERRLDRSPQTIEAMTMKRSTTVIWSKRQGKGWNLDEPLRVQASHPEFLSRSSCTHAAIKVRRTTVKAIVSHKGIREYRGVGLIGGSVNLDRLCSSSVNNSSVSQRTCFISTAVTDDPPANDPSCLGGWPTSPSSCEEEASTVDATLDSAVSVEGIIDKGNNLQMQEMLPYLFH